MRGYPRWTWLGSCVGMLLGLMATAQAEVRPADIAIPTNEEGLGPGYGKRALQFHFDLSGFAGGGFAAADIMGNPIEADRLGFSPQLTVIQPVGSNEAEFSWAIVHLTHTDDRGDVSTLRLGNPFGAYYWAWRELSYQLRLGLGFTAPVAMTRDDRESEVTVDRGAYAAASGMRGGTAPWLWASDTMSGIMHFDGYQRSASGFIWGGQIRVAPMYGFGNAIESRKGFHLAAQADLDLALDTTHVRTQLRASYVTVPTMETSEGGTADEKDQIVVDLEFRIRLGEVDLVAGFTVPLDEPAGMAFDDAKFWGARLGVSTGTALVLPKE